MPDGMMPRAVGRETAMGRLMALDGRGELTTAHVRAVAQGLGVSLRTVWNWLAVARAEGRLTSVTRPRVLVTGDLRERLAVWGGNVAAVHRELAAEAAAAGGVSAVPSLRSLQRAVRQELSAGERAGLRSGEAARRGYDVYGKRPPTCRNACWEGDHKRVAFSTICPAPEVWAWTRRCARCARQPEPMNEPLRRPGMSFAHFLSPTRWPTWCWTCSPRAIQPSFTGYSARPAG